MTKFNEKGKHINTLRCLEFHTVKLLEIILIRQYLWWNKNIKYFIVPLKDDFSVIKFHHYKIIKHDKTIV